MSETWHPTNELRWYTKMYTKEKYDKNGTLYFDTTEPVLQQKWVCSDLRCEWLDIDLVTEKI